MKKEITLTEQEIGSAYAEAMRIVSTSRAIITDETRQCMADALHEFYGLLEARIDSKNRSGQAQAACLSKTRGVVSCQPERVNAC